MGLEVEERNSLPPQPNYPEFLKLHFQGSRHFGSLRCLFFCSFFKLSGSELPLFFHSVASAVRSRRSTSDSVDVGECRRASKRSAKPAAGEGERLSFVQVVDDRATS